MAHTANFLRPTVAVKPGHAMCLFVLLQIYFSSNTLSFGFWKSGHTVFAYMLVFYGLWLAALVLPLSLFLAAGRRGSSLPWLPFAALAVLSVPFSWELWMRSLEIESSAIRNVVRVLLLPTMYLYFRIGLERVRSSACVVLLLCVLSFAGHAGFSVLTGPSQGFDSIKLDKRTNVHVIMLDSFTHSWFSMEFMGLENPAADDLTTLDDTIYAGRMGFSENVSTLPAWATLFNLGRPGGDGRSFSGSAPSRLSALLRDNGYTIFTGYSGDYFGCCKGEYVDHYYRGKIAKLEHDLSCATGKGKLGFCSGFSQSLFSRLYGEDADSKYKGKTMTAWPDKVIDLIDRAERNATGPLFSGFYIYFPFGHTVLNYRTGDAEMFEAYKRRFVKEGQRARKLIEKIDRLRKRYPESIFIVSGDHGPYLSRTAPEEDRRFIVLDRHGVALALLNASNLCARSRDWLAGQRYLTPSRMLAATLACDGESEQLIEHYTDNEEFIRFGGSFTMVRSENR